jgi:TPR repeat protein
MTLENPRQSALAVVALIFAILAALGMFFAVGLVFAIVAIVFGHLSRSRIRASGGKLIGIEIAGASLILGYLAGYISLLVLLIVLTFTLPTWGKHRPPSEVRIQAAELAKKTPEQRYDAVIKKLGDGKQHEAKQLLNMLITKFPSEQRLVFARAVCARSRWEISESAWGFNRAIELDPSTPEANCARYVLDLDERKHVPRNMDALRLLTKDNPDNPLFLWVMAVECRDYFKHTDEKVYSREAEQCYRKLLEIFDVGPVMVHHTFANVLREELVGLDEEALKHNRIAVRMEPTAWSYEGLGMTLSKLRKFDEANRVYAKQIEMDPTVDRYWIHWAYSLEHQGEYEEAINKYKKIIEIDPGYSNAYNRWGVCLMKQGKYSEALEKFIKAIQLDPADAYAYDNAAHALKKLGRDAEAQPYYKKYAEMLNEALDRGDLVAQVNLAECYEKGSGVSKDLTKAVELYRKAADQGNMRAQFNLGLCYYMGKGVSNDFTKAVEWYQKAADQNYDEALFSLGLCNLNGKGVPKDPVKAAEWWQKAAELGNNKAQNNLGYCYVKSIGVSRDFVKAVEWFQKSANQGNSEAQESLGEAYEKGEGVPKDLAKAKEWYQKAAAQGHAKAKKALIKMETK